MRDGNRERLRRGLGRGESGSTCRTTCPEDCRVGLSLSSPSSRVLAHQLVVFCRSRGYNRLRSCPPSRRTRRTPPLRLPRTLSTSSATTTRTQTSAGSTKIESGVKLEPPLTFQRSSDLLCESSLSFVLHACFTPRAARPYQSSSSSSSSYTSSSSSEDCTPRGPMQRGLTRQPPASGRLRCIAKYGEWSYLPK